MDVNANKESRDCMMSMPLEDLEKIVDISGVKLVVNNGEITGISVENVPVAEAENPIVAVLSDALRDIYGELSNARQVIDGLVNYIFDNIILLEDNKDVVMDEVSSLLADMGIDEVSVEYVRSRMSALLDSPAEINYEALSTTRNTEPDEEMEF